VRIKKEGVRREIIDIEAGTDAISTYSIPSRSEGQLLRGRRACLSDVIAGID
jgi:hypothetical protein